MTVSREEWSHLVDLATEARRSARVHGKTRVGAAVLSEEHGVFAGCNVEHMFRSHDIHAEVNALSSMVAAGHGPVIAVVIVAERERFTPCGGCLDWIFELGGPETLVAFHAPGEYEPKLTYKASELMPYYPA